MITSAYHHTTKGTYHLIMKCQILVIESLRTREHMIQSPYHRLTISYHLAGTDRAAGYTHEHPEAANATACSKHQAHSEHPASAQKAPRGHPRLAGSSMRHAQHREQCAKHSRFIVGGGVGGVSQKQRQPELHQVQTLCIQAEFKLAAELVKNL